MGENFFVIYMDNAATTRLSGRALEAMMPYLTEQYANPAGTYSFTHASNAAMEKARRQVADVIGATSAEIFFTSGGTESDNWPLKGTMRANEKKGRHLIISAIEHHAILHSAKALEREGFEVTVLPVDADGVVAPEAVEAAIRPDTVLVSIMAANNEIGTIEPLEAIGAVCKRHGVIFHTDAVQAFGHIPLNVERMHIDLLSVSAHKFHGPKGVGFLSIRKGVKLVPFTTTQELLDRASELARAQDLLIQAAAPADYRAKEVAPQKIKKQGGEPMTFTLVENPDVAATLGKAKRSGQVFVGFAAETNDVLAHAKDKLARKNLDMIVANDVTRPGAGFDVDTNIVTLITKDGQEALPMMSKAEVAQRILDRALALRRE